MPAKIAAPAHLPRGKMNFSGTREDPLFHQGLGDLLDIQKGRQSANEGVFTWANHLKRKIAVVGCGIVIWASLNCERIWAQAAPGLSLDEYRKFALSQQADARRGQALFR